MTQPPNNGTPPEGEGEDNEPQSGQGFDPTGDQSDGDHRPYRPTSHPEDNPGGFTGGMPGYGPGYPGYGPGYGGAPGGSPHDGLINSGEHGTQPGKVDIMMAVRFGFKAVFSNALIWLLGTVVLFIALLALTFIFGVDETGQTSLATDLVIGALSLVVSVLIYTGVLRQVDKRKIRLKDFVENINFLPTLGILLLTGLIAGLIATLLITALIGGTATTAQPTVEEVLTVLGGTLGVMLLMVLLTPLYSYMPWYAADRREGFVGAIVQGFRDGKRNYFRLLAYHVIAGFLVVLAIIVTFGLAAVVLPAVSVVISGHIYRQISSGQFPLA